MGLCPGDKCPGYSKALGKRGRKCYYGEPQCPLGWLDMFFNIIKIYLRLKKGG